MQRIEDVISRVDRYQSSSIVDVDTLTQVYSYMLLAQGLLLASRDLASYHFLTLCFMDHSSPESKSTTFLRSTQRGFGGLSEPGSLAWMTDFEAKHSSAGSCAMFGC